MLRWAEIHLNRLIENYNQVKKLSAGKKIIAVVKANAYGHGIKEVAKTLEKHTDVSAFAVATFDEAEELRNIKIKKDILIMASPLSEDLDKVKELNVIPVIFDFEDLKLAKELKIPFHIKIDTGMGRLGFLENQWDKLLEELKGTTLKGVMTHFCCADEDKSFTEYQFKKFLLFFLKLKSLNFKNLTIHADNSSAIPLKFNKILTHSRVGIALYGAKPYESYPVQLQQAMEVKAKVITTKELPANFPVSYSATYKTKQKEKIAVISFGYADGYLRNFSNKGFVLINNEKCPVRGRVCMDMTIVSSKTAKKGDTVTIFGQKLTFEETAKVAGTIPYELMCAISPRVKRIYFYPPQT